MSADVDMESKTEEKIDESLYSRQLYVIDHESMQKISQNNVLIVGMNGLGAEIAKNVILAGVKSVSILDNTKVEIRNLSSHFYLSESDVGKPRALSCVSQLRELNRYVKVDCITDELSEKLISSGKWQVIVMVGYPLNEQIKYNNICHKNNIKFISTEACGVFGVIFVDLGEKFEIRDTNGESPLQGIVTHVSNENPGVVTVHEDSRHGLMDGDFVIFDEIEGMKELNNGEPIKMKSKSPFSFELDCDTTNFSKYSGQGMYFQVKQPKFETYQTLEEQLKNPSLLPSDFVKDPSLQHVFYIALNEFRNEKSRFPLSTSMEDANLVVSYATKIAETNNADENKMKIEINNEKFASLARCSGAVINPMAATLGGIVGQEVLKACSGKFTPIKQLFYLDCFEALPNIYDKNIKIDVEREFSIQNNRYDDNISVFGITIQNKLFNSKMFLVGAGAIGCEMLKNWSLMGVACGTKDKDNNGNPIGKIYVTDMDTIEKSNLNRQFLFRDKDVGNAKSTCAGNAIRVMNPNINVIPQENRVGKESETIYHDHFWQELTGVCTALDNVDARLYVDAQCVKYKKPLLESGTLGTKGNTQIVVPEVTESYGSSRDPPQKEIPICTLKNFPNKIEHTIQWARDEFDGVFVKSPDDANSYLSDPNYLIELSKDTTAEMSTLQSLNSFLVNEKPLTYDDCVSWSRNKLEYDYKHKIEQLLYNFPKDATTSEGAPFWSGPKRAPDPVIFDQNDPTHMAYVISGAMLRAQVFNIKGTSDTNSVKQILSKVIVKQYKINKKAKIAADEDEAKKMAEEQKVDDDYDEQVKKLKESLPDTKTLVGYKLQSLEFEKDDDTNFHMDFITAASNLRARNYRIKEANKHQTKGIAGKIIPAIATTTALITGLISMEFYKLLQFKLKTIEDYRNAYVNLALPLVTMSEPVPTPTASIKKKGSDWNYTLWDKVEIKNNKNMTCNDLIKYFEDEWGMELNMLSYGTTILYAFYMGAKKQQTRRNAKLKKLVKAITKKPIPETTQFLEFEVSCSYQEDDNDMNDDDDDEDPELPTIRLYIG